MERDYEQITALMEMKALLQGVGIFYREYYYLLKSDEAIQFIGMVEKLHLDMGVMAIDFWEPHPEDGYNEVPGYIGVYDYQLEPGFVEFSYREIKNIIHKWAKDTDLLHVTFEWNDLRQERIISQKTNREMD